jgi:hypothetical protein
MDANTNMVSKGKPLARPPKGLRRKLERMLAGVTGMLEDDLSIPTSDGPVPKARMVQRLTEGVARFQAIDAQLIALRHARQQLLQDAEALHETYNLWKDSIGLILGRKSPALAHFGIKPRQPRQPLTSEKEVVRAEKARQTRRLRHTGGRRQKAALRYQGKVDVTTKLRAPPPPAAPATPADPPGDGSG